MANFLRPHGCNPRPRSAVDCRYAAERPGRWGVQGGHIRVDWATRRSRAGPGRSRLGARVLSVGDLIPNKGRATAWCRGHTRWRPIDQHRVRFFDRHAIRPRVGIAKGPDRPDIHGLAIARRQQSSRSARDDCHRPPPRRGCRRRRRPRSITGTLLHAASLCSAAASVRWMLTQHGLPASPARDQRIEPQHAMIVGIRRHYRPLTEARS